MNQHERYEQNLAVLSDLSPQERAEIDAHLEDCASCRRTMAAYAEQDRSIRELPRLSLSPALRGEIVRRAVGGEAPATARRAGSAPVPHVGRGKGRLSCAVWRRILVGLVSAIAAVAVVLATLLRPGQSGVTPASAADLLRAAAQASMEQFPYTGTSEVSFLTLPQYTLPDSAAAVIGQHRAVVQWEVQDSSHFRVDIRTVLPAINAGRETVVVHGKDIYRYDTRTETAAVGTLYPFLDSAAPGFAAQLLPILRNGGEYGGAPEPDPAESIRRYLAQNEQQRANVHGYVRVIGHGWLLGRRVDIVQFAPLVIACDKSLRNNVCAVPVQGYGVGRAWIDHDHPFILQYREYGFGGLHNLHTERLRFEYRVTSVHYGQAPSPTDLAFHPPVPVQKAGHWTIGSSEGTDLPKNGQFIYAPSPQPYSRLHWEVPSGMGGGQYIGPLPRVTYASMLYSAGKHVITYLHKGDRYGFGLYLAGAYLYVQERIQVHGLPAGLKEGTPVAVGACRMWVARAGSGALTAAFQHGSTAVQILSRGLSRAELERYACRAIYAGHWY